MVAGPIASLVVALAAVPSGAGGGGGLPRGGIELAALAVGVVLVVGIRLARRRR